MRGWVVVLGALVALAALPVGCTSFDAASSAEDGGVGAGDSGGFVAPDANPAVDGGASDGSLASGFCASVSPPPTHCSDFESAPPWTTHEQNGGVAKIVAAADAPSGAKVLETSGSSTVVTVAVQSALGPQLDVPVAGLGGIVLSAAVFVDSLTATRDLDIMSLVLRDGSGLAYTLDVEIKGDGSIRIEENQPGGDSESTVAIGHTLPFKKWVRFSLKVALTAGSSSSVLELDGQTIALRILKAHLMTLADVAWFGEPSNQETTWRVLYDDAYVTVTK
jgi:hypothetical protein